MEEFVLRPKPPFRLDLTVWVLRRVPVNEIDRWDGDAYHRVLATEQGPVLASVAEQGTTQSPGLNVRLSGPGAKEARPEAEKSLRRLLGTGLDVGQFYDMAESDAVLRSLARPFIGFHPPRFGSVYEALVNALACQQLSLTVGITLLNRLCKAFAPAVESQHAFVRPSDLAGATVEQIRQIGFSTRKAQNMLDLSVSEVEGTTNLEALAEFDDETVVSKLCELRGVGRWTAHYVALRALGRLDVFPADDQAAQTKLARWLRLEQKPDYAQVQDLIRQWAPYRGLIYFCLLLSERAKEGLV